MPIHVNNVRRLLADFDFPRLFTEELGWDGLSGEPRRVEIAGETYELRPVAQKRGVAVLLWQGAPGEALPDNATRLRIHREVSKLHFQHVLIFADAGRTAQDWSWVRRMAGRPVSPPPPARWRAARSDEALIQRLDLLAVSMQEEEKLTHVDVTRRLDQSFTDRVTKQFYERFAKEHTAFLGFIRGIEVQGDREWYASVMLNRLMFVYFIQKKGFLDGDRDYLRNRMRRVRELLGSDQFHSFYRSFLLVLFHQGLGSSGHSPELVRLIGAVPYLNGGLFDVHQLEQGERGACIQIADDAFVSVLSFFDQYEWHLDDREVRKGNEINPDVLGYIFEKYINRKQMGAYYTKEDVTEYVAKSTIVPWLFDAAKRRCQVAFRPDGPVWSLLRDDPDRYVYATGKTGILGDSGAVRPLSPEIEAGLHDESRRSTWNRPAEAAYGLPGETWREHVARRSRLLDLRRRLSAGEVRGIDELVSLNLDLRQFAQDVVANAEGPELLRAFWRSMAGYVPQRGNDVERAMTVLDPTCGSGAFLFAAVGILQPLYDACLDRMQGFVDDADAKGHTATHPDFRDTLTRVNDVRLHPNREYFVLKSIILNNLFGVDIMEEAVEICKLRLFLKLMSQVERVEQVEPLPDMDLNIRAGNSLVGFATFREVQQAVEGEDQAELMIGTRATVLQRITDEAREAEVAYKHFLLQQLRYDQKAADYHQSKSVLVHRLRSLEQELDRYLAKEYGIEADRYPGTFRDWRLKHAPFHWFAAFYGVLQEQGGFDVIIGNPPYIAASRIRREYRLLGYKTAGCPDVYANVLERSANLLGPSGRSGMIVPLSLAFSEDFQRLRELLYASYEANWFTSFARIPAALFGGDVRVRNTIHLGARTEGARGQWASILHRWFERSRPHLFSGITYAPFDPLAFESLIVKSGSAGLNVAFTKLMAGHWTLSASLSSRPTRYPLHFKQSAYNWLAFARDQPPCYEADGRETPQTQFSTVHFADAESRDTAFLLLNGKLMFAFWVMLGDDFHLTRNNFARLPVDLRELPPAARAELLPLAEELDHAMHVNVSFKMNAGKRVGNYNLARCRSITGRSDAIFARWLGLEPVWQDVELLYSRIVKTEFDEDAVD